MDKKTFSSERVSKITDTISKMIDSHFAATLGKEPDIVKIVKALIYKESSFNVNAIGSPVSYRKGTTGFNYMTSSSINAFLSENPSQISVILEGVRAYGLMQVMGWNLVRGGAPSGKCEVERLRPDLASSLCVNPGTSVTSMLIGESNLQNSILAGLVILEGKYRSVTSVSGGFGVKGDPYKRVFVSKISAAVAAYLGLGKADLNNTTPEEYSAQIVGGSVYAKANGSSLKIRDSAINIASAVGPSTNGSSLNNIGVPGCG